MYADFIYLLFTFYLANICAIIQAEYCDDDEDDFNMADDNDGMFSLIYVYIWFPWTPISINLLYLQMSHVIEFLIVRNARPNLILFGDDFGSKT